MLARLAACLALLAPIHAAFGQMPSHPMPGQVAPKVHAAELVQAPAGLEPGDIDLSRFVGRAVYVKFWSTGCLPCIQAMPRHAELKAKYGDRLVILGVTPQTPDEIAEFLQKQQPAMIVLSDPEQATWRRYFAHGLGTGTLIAADGRVSRISVNDLALDEAMIDAALRNEYEPGPPIGWNGEILPNARAIGAAWGENNGRGRIPFGQDPYSLANEATFQIICRPAYPHGRYWGSSMTGASTLVTMRARFLIRNHIRPAGYGPMEEVPPNRVVGPEWLDDRYFDFIALTPGLDDDTRDSMLQAAIEAGLGVRIRRDEREVEGFRLVRLDDAPELPVAEGPYRRWLGERLDDGRFITRVEKHTFGDLAKALERTYRAPVVTDIDDIRAFDLVIPSNVDAGTLPILSVALEREYGLKLVPDTVTISVIVVEDTAPQAAANP